jgi:hypothetical protein
VINATLVARRARTSVLMVTDGSWLMVSALRVRLLARAKSRGPVSRCRGARCAEGLWGRGVCVRVKEEEDRAVAGRRRGGGGARLSRGALTCNARLIVPGAMGVRPAYNYALDY